MSITGLMKSHHCGRLNLEHLGDEVALCGWVNKYRDLGGLHFIDLRDKYGLIQLGFEQFEGDIKVLKDVGLESVIRVQGLVQKRPESAVNKNLPTGEIEVQVKKLEILSRSEVPPFLPLGGTEATEDLKLKYRYLDLRSPKLQNILSLRSKVYQQTRSFLYNQDFTEVETPILYKTTPEGARDYIVPSRVHKGKVYALPQSPQTLKQLLMIANTDRYFQICKCFRDEDLRADRQPEFTQIDIEVSFSTEEYMRNLCTEMLKTFFNLPEEFKLQVMDYAEAMNLYGSDKPDIRFGLEHQNCTSLFQQSSFQTFVDISQGQGLIKGIWVPKSLGELARKNIDELTNVVKPYGGKGVAWFKKTKEGLSGGISKFIDDKILNELKDTEEEGIWLFCADSNHSTAHACADAVRRHLGRFLELIKPGENKFLWINKFPLLDYVPEENRYVACHHPFTRPLKEDEDKFLQGIDLASVRAEAYDLVCNGYELGGGSLRIYDQNLQSRMFQLLGLSEEETKRQFGFFVEALQYGTPPHGGIAFGLDRLVMILAQTENIRDVIAFPKTNSATDLMAQAPSIANTEQFEELGIQLSGHKDG